MSVLAPETPTINLFDRDRRNAYDSLAHAQFLAFAPFLFQSAVALRDQGILRILEDHRRTGLSLTEVVARSHLSLYAVRVLLQAGMGAGLVYRKEEKYFLTKSGYFFLTNEMTRVNTDFMRDVCYAGAADMQASLEEGRPAGLHHLGNWATIYEGLSVLPEPARQSWFRFDHFYSDPAFAEAVSLVFAYAPDRILDIGANTGRFSMACLAYDPEVQLGLVDLDLQLDVARQEMDAAGYQGRYQTFAIDLLHPAATLPAGYEVIWMSQFLSCFSDGQILSILERCYAALPEHGRVMISEPFWDYQRDEAAAMSLQMASFYFTVMANGNSQMYESKVLKALIAAAGFVIEREVRQVGHNHTMLILQKK